MLRKTFTVLFVTLLVGVLSCSDNELMPTQNKPVTPVMPGNSDGARLLTTRTIYVNGRTSASTLETAGVYYQINGGGWNSIATLSGTNCQSLGSFSANDGDIINLAVAETATDGVSFLVKTGSGCPSTGSLLCGNLVDGSDFSHTVTASVTLSIQAEVRTNVTPTVFLNCYF